MTEPVTSTSTSSARAMPDFPAGSAQGWRAVAASRDLENGEVIPSSLDEIAIAVWRSNDGAVHAWFDRCPHRGMRLSHGSVSAAGLVCPYHGWRFGSDTQCNHIPAHPQMTPPKAARTKDFKVAEKGGYVWASIDTEPGESTALQGASHPVRSIFIAADKETIMSALARFPLDPAGVRKTPHGGEDIGFGTSETDDLNLEAQWSPQSGKTVSYAVHLQPLKEKGHMVHLASNEALDKDEMAAMNVSLVALRDWIDLTSGTFGQGRFA